MADLVTLTIDEQELSVPKGTLVVDAAATLNKEIPVFCSHPKLDPVACCRMCLVEIDMGGPRSRGPMLMTACSVPVMPGMQVWTDTEKVQETQEANLAFILLNHPLDCPICDKGGECPLQDQTMRYGPGISQLVEAKRHKKKHYHISDTIVLDQERCVVCWRCIRYLQEWEDKPQLQLFERGGETLIDIQEGQPVNAKTSGNIIDMCPVGALTNQVSRFNYRPWQIDRTPTICPHFSTGDNIRVDSRTHKVRRIVGRENMQVNDQWIADKTRFAYEWVNSDGRLKQPMVRKDGELQPASWGEALQTVADKLRTIKINEGNDAIGGIGSTKLSNESNYLLQRFMRQIIGTNNVDHRNGGDIAATATGIPALADVMKPQYGPNPKVDTVLLFGLDPSEELPILDLHLKRSIRLGGMKVIVAHPRQIELTRYDGPYLGYTPGSEVTLLNGLTRAVIQASGQAGNEGVAEVEGWTQNVTAELVEGACGVEMATVEAAAKLLADSENALILYGPMVAGGEAGQQVLNGLNNVAIASGNYEGLAYVGLDANSQGCRDMGVLPTQLPGHVSIDDVEAIQEYEAFWDCQLRTSAGKTYKQMLDSAGDDIKAMYIMGADPASERASWSEALDNLDFLVVQELFLTETAQKADVVLPAVSWVEGDGTFTNVERRIQRAPKAITDPSSKAAPDWMILDHLSSLMGGQWQYANARSITNEISKFVSIYEELDWDELGDEGMQWDAADVRPEAAYREAIQPTVPPAKDNTLAVVAGTVTYDGGSMFSMTQEMSNMTFGRRVGLNPADASSLGVDDEQNVTVGNAYGQLSLAVRIDTQVQQGTAWIPESLPSAPVGSLLNGSDVEFVEIVAG